jgi:hypothetical protein
MASRFKIIFSGTTMADDAASPAAYGNIEQLGAEGDVQIEDAYNSAVPFEAPRGNLRGQFIARYGTSYSGADAAWTAFKAAQALNNTQATLVVTYAAATLTFANAILRKVERVKWDNLWLEIRLTFEITSIA